jgi:hypothetical protein
MRRCICAKLFVWAPMLVAGCFLALAPERCGAQAFDIECRAGGLRLDAHAPDVRDNGCRVQLWQHVRGNQNQEWVLEPVGKGWVHIRNRASGLVLDADLADVHENGCRVMLWQANGGANQHWKIVGQGGGWGLIENRASGLVLDAHLPDVQLNGCRVQLWHHVQGNANQLWRIERR